MGDPQDEHRESVRALADGKPSHRRLLILLAISAAALAVAVIFIRTAISNKHDTALCEKVDRFVVTIEKRVMANPDMTDAQKKAAIRFYENFRNDPPACRTPGP